jgi:hypothetical protein
MKLKLEFTEKERHYLHRLLAVVLSLFILISMTLSATLLGSHFDWKSSHQLVAGFIASPFFYLIIDAVFKHYR